MNPIARRRKALSLYRILSVAQFILAFCLLFFSVQCVLIHDGTAVAGVAYYSGGFLTGAAMSIPWFIGGAIFYKGDKAIATKVLATKSVKPVILVYLIVIPPVTICCIIGIVLTSLYGLCSNVCSYSIKTSYNLGMAIFLLVMESFSVVTCILGLVITYIFGTYFGFEICSKTSFRNMSKVRPADGDEDRDVYVLEKWRLKMDKSVDFNKVQEYLSETRATGEEESGDSVSVINEQVGQPASKGGPSGKQTNKTGPSSKPANKTGQAGKAGTKK